MYKKTFYIICSVALLLAVLILALPEGMTSRMKLAFSSFFLPLFGVASTMEQGTSKVAEVITPRKVLIKEIESLQSQNEQLRIQGLRYEKLTEENNRLRRILGIQKTLPWTTTNAMVIGRDPANWWRTIQIDVGSRHGVKTNMPVISVEGLVGRVNHVGPASSEVVLIGDPNCRVSVLIQETREHGVIAPSSVNPLDASIVDLGYLSRNSVLKPDQLVVTSGYGGTFPKGIPVGRLIDYQTIGYGLYTEARVKLSVNLGALENVWVILK